MNSTDLVSEGHDRHEHVFQVGGVNAVHDGAQHTYIVSETYIVSDGDHGHEHGFQAGGAKTVHKGAKGTGFTLSLREIIDIGIGSR